jgi:serine/threonine-protein kinase
MGCQGASVEAGAVIGELKRRRVFRALVGYGVASFAVLQIIEPIMHGLHWREEVLTYVVVGLAIGFPVVVSLAWIFDVNHGRIERSAPSQGLGGVRLAAMLAGIGALAAAPGLVWYFSVREPQVAASAVNSPPSIAVLPFANLSGDKESDYFSDGITEELINALANVEGLRVASRTAVFALKGKELDVGQIGQRLNVTTLLEGSVRRDGNALRITAQLINVKDGYHLWSKTYDREMKGIFALYDEIARGIAQSLRRKLVRDDAARPSTSDSEAHDLYLKGRFFWNRRSLAGFRKAEEYFRQAIAKDPDYALAYTGLSDAIALRLDYDSVRASEILPQARDAAQRALEIDPALAEAHAALGNILWHEFEWGAASRELRAAIALKPNYATAHQWLAEVYLNNGRIGESRAEIKLALEADPLAPIMQIVAAEVEMFSGNLAGARTWLAKTQEADPSFELPFYWLYDIALAEGRIDEAETAASRITGWPEDFKLAYRAVIAARRGKRPDMMRTLEELEALSRRGYVLPSLRALAWEAAGDRERAFAFLRQACAELDGNLAYFKVDPIWSSLHADRRFAEIVHCMKLE